jgi:hypothetical protein
MRIEIQKKGRFTPQERYKFIMKKKLAASREEALGSKAKKIGFNDKIKDSLSKTTDKAIKELSAKRAAKAAKAIRNMVLIEPRRFSNGRLTKSGKILDVADNVVGTVNRKNGKMATTMGWGIGKYKPRSYMTAMNIQSAINQYSPYFIAQRKAQLGDNFNPQTGGLHQPHDTINVYGYSPPPQQSPGSSIWGSSDSDNWRAGPGVTAWGVASNNVWGSFADNAWGTNADNVWGGNESNIWGGVGDAGNLWKWKGMNVWNTGSGTNYLKGLTSRVAAFFGLGLKRSVHGDHANAGSTGGTSRFAKTSTTTRTIGSSGPRSSGPRTGGSVPRGRTGGSH